MTIILILIKASVLLAAALLATRMLRTSPAATRHALWSVTFAALLALPLLDGAVPSLRVPVPDGWAMQEPAAPSLKTRPAAETTRPAAEPGPGVAPGLKTRPATVSVDPSAVAGRTAIFDEHSIGTLVRLVWLVGALGAACALIVSLLRVRWLTQTATDVTDPAWREAAETIGARLALGSPARVVVSDAVRTPMAGGVWRPLIFLPADAASWSAERRDVVLAHELSHIAGRDPIRHIAARFAVGCYWFHPLAWLAAKQASLAREQACDEAVLALGVRPSDYARVLLDLAETMARPRTAAALPMVERSLLETRLMAILDHGIRPSRLRQSFVPAAATALFALTLAAAQPAARSIDVRAPAATPASPIASIAPRETPAAPRPAPAQRAPQPPRDTACWTDRPNFSGYTNTDERGIRDRVGSIGSALLIQQRYGDLFACMVADGEAASRAADGPSAWVGRAPHVVIETIRGGSTVSLDIRRQSGAPQTAWSVNGAERPFDAAAQAWRDAVLAVLDRTWEVSMLRGEQSSLRGEISSLRGEESSLRGEISSLRGEISSMRGQQSSVRGEESSLRGEISAIQGQVSSLRGQISSERGSISSLEASRYGLSDAERERLASLLRSHQTEIARLEREIEAYDAASKIAAVEKQIRALDADGKVAAIEDQIRAFNESGRVAAIEKQIQALDVEGKTAAIERQIRALDVDRRSREIEDRLDEAVRRLQQALATIK
jgi:beta-lactamase regulating signal transducer with metallopeptidase domain/predicted  nucleic acid-binding Zn-ribbon protein